MILEFLSIVAQFFLNLANSLGYIGIFLYMTIESTIIPLPAELILIPAGALVAQGKLSFTPLLIAATLGSVAGALINYFLAYYLGRKPFNYFIHKYGKLLLMNENSLL